MTERQLTKNDDKYVVKQNQNITTSEYWFVFSKELHGFVYWTCI